MLSLSQAAHAAITVFHSYHGSVVPLVSASMCLVGWHLACDTSAATVPMSLVLMTGVTCHGVKVGTLKKSLPKHGGSHLMLHLVTFETTVSKSTFNEPGTHSLDKSSSLNGNMEKSISHKIYHGMYCDAHKLTA